MTVGYERIRGLREPGQRRGGSLEVNKSKTVGVPVGALYRAFADGGRREARLPDAPLEIRTATKDKSLRITWGDGTSVDVYFTDQGERKSSVALQHRKLPDKATAERLRAFWGERLAALAAWLAGETTRPGRA